jgi:hypothetical protein
LSDTTTRTSAGNDFDDAGMTTLLFDFTTFSEFLRTSIGTLL